MKIAFNPSTVAALITPPNNKDITFDLRGRNIFARGVKFQGTDTWRDIKINNVSIGSNILDLRNGSNTTLTNTNGVVTINSTWRPVVDNLTSDSTTSSLSAKQGKILKSLIDGKANSGHTHDDRYLKLTGGTMASNALITFADSGSWSADNGPQGARGGLYWTGQSDYVKLYAEETAKDNLNLVIQLGDDNSNGLSIRDYANTQTSYISASGVITTKTFKGNLDWSYITNKPSSYTPSAHTHTWTSITDKLVAGNKFNIVNAGFNAGMWFNYVPINDGSKTATVTGYHFGNGHQGYSSITASGFVKNGSSSNYVLLGDGGHRILGNSNGNIPLNNGTVNTNLNADTLDGEHAKNFVRAGSYENNNLNSLDTYSFIRSVNSQVSSTSPKGNIGWYNVIQLVHRNGDADGPNYIGQIALGMTSNVNDIFFRCKRTDPWKTIIHSNNYTEFINNYYWANVKISTSSSTTTSPTVLNLTATSYIRMGNIYLQNTNEINSANGIHLNFRNSGNVNLCAGGGLVGIGTISPSYKLDVNGNIHSSGTINCNALNVGSTLIINGSAISCSASDISIEAKKSGSLLINSREALGYDLDYINMINKTSFFNRLGLRTNYPDTNHSTDDVTVLIGSLRQTLSFEFRPAMDGQLLFLKVEKLYSGIYFWCTARNCSVIRADNFGTHLSRNEKADRFGDRCARIFIYKQDVQQWYEFYCG